MTKLLFAPLAAFALLSAACDKAPANDAPMSNELRAPGLPAPVAKGGIPDDSIKPVASATIKPVVKGGKSGVPDDSIKPAPSGGIKPIAPVATVARGGVPDDSVKPVAPGAVPPAKVPPPKP